MWAKSYIPSGTAKSFTVTTDIIVASTDGSTANSVIAAGKTENWIKIPGEQYASKTPTSDSEIDTPTSNVYCLTVKADGNTFNHEKRVIHFKVTGITGVKAIGQANFGRGFQIGATEVTSDLNENSSMTIVAGNNSAQNPVSCSGLDKSKTYIISIFAYSSDTYLYAVRFISDPYETSIGIGDLCYAVGTGGKNANSNGLDRAVGGFNLTFGGGDGIKYNGGNQLIARHNTGTITIALDDNNSKKNITKVVMTRSAAGTGMFTASDNATVTNSGTTITWQGTACKTITFTQTGDDVSITNIAITTDVAPTFEKVTPTVTINPTSASVKKGTAGTFTTTATSSPKNFNWTWTPTSLANVEYYTKNDGGTKTADQLGTPGTFETTSASTTTGNNTLVASFAGNDFFKAVNNAATYTLTINEPVASTPDNTVQTYPYTWNFANGSSTWGSSSTQLPISDWTKGNETYYNYNVPNSETGFNIDAIKGLRFQNIGYLGLDWGYGHIWSTAGTITIPNVPIGMTIQIVAQNRNDSNPATTITPTNATYTGEGTATLGTEYTTYTFTSTATGTDVSFVFSGKSSIKSIAVLKTATPHKWDFETSTYWSTTRGGLNASYWVESSDVANNPDEVMSNVAFSGEELTKDGTNKIPEMEGLVMTAVKGSSRFKIGKYYRLGNYSKASITIPSMTTGQTVTFKVETATAGMERGITATSSNLELISGQVSDKVSYYTFRVTSDGDGEFRQTSEVAGLKIYYIDLKAATPAATELKFVDGSNNDISNKQVNIVSGTSGTLDSYFQLSKRSGIEWNNVDVTVDPSSLLTYDTDGTFTMGSGTGTATIKARTESSPVETGIAVLYVSVKAQPTVKLSANGPFSVNYGQDFNGGTSTVTGKSSVDLPVKYKSSDERVATVNSSGVVTGVGVGTTTITAYTEETSEYLYAEASYTVTYSEGSVVFRFVPSEIDLPLGTTITPYMNYDPKSAIDATDFTFTVSESGIVNTEDVVSLREADKHLCKITSINDASKVGETVIITVKGKVKNSSPARYYYTTIKVNITAADARNFDWENSSDIYIYEDTYLPIPRISGNSSGNNHFSNSDKNGGNGDASGNLGKNYRTEAGSNYKYYWESGNHYDPLHAYVYEIKNGIITWNNNSNENTNYHLNEGYPDFYLTDESDNETSKGYILWAKSDNKDYGDTLLVYAKTAGVIKLHAKDSQNGTECTPITIHIMPKSTIYDSTNGELTNQIGTISFPYTWDFTDNVDLSSLDNSIYWDNVDGVYCNSALTMNVNFADGEGTGNTGTKTNKAILGYTSGSDHHILPWFKGMKIQLGNSKYNAKIHKIRLRPYVNSTTPRLYFDGGTHTISLPRPGYTNPNTGFNEPASYKIIIKMKTTTNTEIDLNVNGTNHAYKSFEKDKVPANLNPNEDVIISQEVTSGQNVTLGVANVSIYWIAMSTEEKNLSYFKHSNSNLTYAAAAYSYPEDLDLSKSNEVNGATAYYASSFTTDNDAQGAYSNEPEQQYAVVMSQLSNLGTYVKAGTGMLLRYDNVTGIDVSNDATIPFNMIANPKNVETYSANQTVTGTNYLIGTGASSTTINGHETIGSVDYTNFMMSAAYKYYTDITNENTAQGDYRFDRNWSFYPVMNINGSVGPQKSYLRIPGILYVNKEGKIVDIPASSRSYGRAADNDTPGAPASRGALSIVFDDDPSNGQGTTGISTVATETTVDSDAWYTLQGVRVETPTKGGIYIHKGRKIVVK